MLSWWGRENDKQLAEGYNLNGDYIDRRLYEKILCHVVKNTFSDFGQSLFLGIQGPPGEGKSYQTKRALNALQVKPFFVSGSSLSGRHEGDSIEAISKAYLEASAYMNHTQKSAAIIVDDFDLSVAATSSRVEYTVNSQLLTGFLMNLADEPTNVNGSKSNRVPIFVTGNNLTKLYGPLVRDGRFDMFEWNPSVEQKIRVVVSVLSPYVSDADEAKFQSLVRQNSDRPIAFFSSLRSDIMDHLIVREFQFHGQHLGETIRKVLSSPPKIEFGKLFELMETRARNRPIDYLKAEQHDRT
jgi:SpoVK/Ycf46/Vps4 family AAA+-type ATPase